MTTSVLKWLWSKSNPLEELTQIHVLCWSFRAWQCSVLDTAKLSLVLTLPLPELPPGPCFRGDHLHPTAGVSMSWVLAGNAPPAQVAKGRRWAAFPRLLPAQRVLQACFPFVALLFCHSEGRNAKLQLSMGCADCLAQQRGVPRAGHCSGPGHSDLSSSVPAWVCGSCLTLVQPKAWD